MGWVVQGEKEEKREKRGEEERRDRRVDHTCHMGAYQYLIVIFNII